MNILIVTTSPHDVVQIQMALRQGDYQLTVVEPKQLLNGPMTLDQFNCLLLRVDSEKANELSYLADIERLSPDLPVIVLAEHWEIANVVRAIKMGADEVCELPGRLGDLDKAIERLQTSHLHRQLPYHELIPRSILQRLTSEEARILHLLVQGRTTKEVGATLDVSIRTVHYRKKEMLRKLGVQNRSEAIELIRLSAGNLFAGLETTPQI